MRTANAASRDGRRGVGWEGRRAVGTAGVGAGAGRPVLCAARRIAWAGAASGRHRAGVG